MKKFITFSGGENYYASGKRLFFQAQKLNLFDELILYTDNYLKNDPDFWNIHSNFVTNNPRGYGYWIWKPYIIKKTMETMSDGDVLMYLDSGCEIDINKKKIIDKYLELVKTENIIGTLTFIEKEWNKMDLIKKIDVKPFHLSTRQHQAGALLFVVNNETIQLVNKWYELACDYHNIDDTPSIEPNIRYFREHRHDQSIFSLLTKKYNLFSNYSLYNCIEYVRNRTGNSILTQNINTVQNNTVQNIKKMNFSNRYTYNNYY